MSDTDTAATAADIRHAEKQIGERFDAYHQNPALTRDGLTPIHLTVTAEQVADPDLAGLIRGIALFGHAAHITVALAGGGALPWVRRPEAKLHVNRGNGRFEIID